jgi:NADPH-dependent 2,4-dienoyl-CoA reductase/sulfur reductase-like enzyme
VVVGASLAGLTVCEELRRRGYEGTITLVGDEIHWPYDRPPLSKEILAGTKGPDDIRLIPDERLAELDVDLLRGVRATGIDIDRMTVAILGADDLRYDDLVIATGASARPLPGIGELGGIHLLRTLDDALAIRAELEGCQHLVVVGGGFIGAEVASVARLLGREVTILDPMPVMLSRGLGGSLSDAIGTMHREHGVYLRCGVGVTGFDGTGSIEAVRTSDGSLVESDLVVVGVGATPNTGWLNGSGLELADGVVCDAQCRALGARGVWAAGDVARWYHAGRQQTIRLEHWTNAVEQATAVANRICGGSKPFEPVPYVWSDQFGKRIQCFGSVLPDDDLVVVDGELGTDRFVVVVGRGDRLVGVIALDGGRAIMPYRRLLLADASWQEALAA